MMEGSGAGSVMVTYESVCGSRRAKNIRILCIWIRIRLRIRNTFWVICALLDLNPADKNKCGSGSKLYLSFKLRKGFST